MTLTKFLNVTALLIGFLATYYWIKGTLQLNPKIISELSSTKMGYNADIIESLSAQKADSIIAFSLLGMTFLLQFAAYLVSETVIISPSLKRSIIFALIFITGVGIVVYKINGKIARSSKNITKKIIHEKMNQ